MYFGAGELVGVAVIVVRVVVEAVPKEYRFSLEFPPHISELAPLQVIMQSVEGAVVEVGEIEAPQ